ncbi:UNVERIFIED_CONTAM: hypothetical protein FKN15_062090 [Acipenser sinensis]
MDRNALAELLQALESRRDAEERRREERYTALIERSYGIMDRNALAELLQALESRRDAEAMSQNATVVMSRNAARGHITKCCQWLLYKMLPVGTLQNAVHVMSRYACPWSYHEMLPMAMSQNAARGNVKKCCLLTCH